MALDPLDELASLLRLQLQAAREARPDEVKALTERVWALRAAVEQTADPQRLGPHLRLAREVVDVLSLQAAGLRQRLEAAARGARALQGYLGGNGPWP